MAQKTFAPQMARLLQHIVKYDARHHAKIVAVTTAQQTTDLQTILNAINNSWAAVVTTETP